MTIRPIGQSGYLLKCGTTEIIIDPYLSDIVNKVAGRARSLPAPMDPKEIMVDAVVCTHDHMDHLDPEAAAEMSKEQFFITTHEGKAHLAELGQIHVAALSEGEQITVGDLCLKAVFAKHSCEAFGLIVKGEGYTLYFSGDTLYDERLFAVAEEQPDITFICINGRLGNMNVQEAVVTAQKIGAKVSVPNHFDMFASNTEDPRKFTDRVSGSKVLEFNKEYNIKEILQ